MQNPRASPSTFSLPRWKAHRTLVAPVPPSIPHSPLITHIHSDSPVTHCSRPCSPVLVSMPPLFAAARALHSAWSRSRSPHPRPFACLPPCRRTLHVFRILVTPPCNSLPVVVPSALSRWSMHVY
ncbi:hypothetical protein VTO73DRAFT_6604 [Trametes versicolor]